MKSPPVAPYRGRFAPSPTGQLHFGSLVAAVGSWLRARACGGTWLIRVEDIDPPREIAGAADHILATLAAFGMTSDEPVLWQHDREVAYAQALEQLTAQGVAFPCWCSRTDLAASGGLHQGPCRAAPDPERRPAWRARVPQHRVQFDDVLYGPFGQNLAQEVGDFVIRRVEGYFAYQLAVVVDDAAQGITEVVRGADLLDSTPRQIWLQEVLALPQPAYLHLPLAMGPDGRKLSKQDRSRPVDGSDPLPALHAALAFLGVSLPAATLCRSPESVLRDAIDRFEIKAIPRPLRDVQAQDALQ
ncbi:tRNA glutamyl-Q(34) synthetase GluQRS [Tahibacter amnicola]|uniref:Glutamyl-Q tRNA(Asp) synthetase n=1 Tax=Tahibacter amnicola TaxID=2976241 RepID=A0ABY6BPE0_9GAMM|nr:tRNA glutamyl-Q(34) synthetase GluQRS [Tahibacter amnicola]UXI70421.1 tRNA glutamyl-Q(34) synthetase GluQRS [Tahibacter amnicola]